LLYWTWCAISKKIPKIVELNIYYLLIEPNFEFVTCSKSTVKQKPRWNWLACIEGKNTKSKVRPVGISDVTDSEGGEGGDIETTAKYVGLCQYLPSMCL
jgi:hypothetical protein